MEAFFLNFKLLILMASILSVSCGVKSRPNPRPETAIQSYTNSFLDQDKESEKKLPLPVK
jgi:hypothetical protein